MPENNCFNDESLVQILYDVGEGLSDYTEKCEFDLDKCLEIGTASALQDFYHRKFAVKAQIGVTLVAPWLKLIGHLNASSEEEFQLALRARHGNDRVRDYHADLIDDQEDWDTFLCRADVALKPALSQLQPTFLNLDEIKLYDLNDNRFKFVQTRKTNYSYTFLCLGSSRNLNHDGFRKMYQLYQKLPEIHRKMIFPAVVIHGNGPDVRTLAETAQIPPEFTIFADERGYLINEIFPPKSFAENFSCKNIRKAIFQAMKDCGRAKLQRDPAIVASYLTSEEDSAQLWANILLNADGRVIFWSDRVNGALEKILISAMTTDEDLQSERFVLHF